MPATYDRHIGIQGCVLPCIAGGTATAKHGWRFGWRFVYLGLTDNAAGEVELGCSENEIGRANGAASISGAIGRGVGILLA